MATCWEMEPRRTVGMALRPWDPTTTVPAILEAAISVVGAQPVTLWGVVCTSGAIVRTMSMAEVTTGSLLAGASLVPSWWLSLSTTSFSRACTRCSGRRVRRASFTAQRRANSLEGEPSTPTTTLPSVIWWVLMLGSLGRRRVSGPPSMAARGLPRIRRWCLGVKNLDESLTPEGRMDVSHGLRSRNGDPCGRDQRGAQRAGGIGRFGRAARASWVSAQAACAGSAADNGPARTRDVVKEARAWSSLERLHLLVGIRVRGDPAHPDADVRARGIHPAVADDTGRSCRLGVGHPVLPAGRHAVHQGWWFVRCGAGELRPNCRAGGCGRTHGRLHRHRGRSVRRRDERGNLCDSGVGAIHP